MNSRDNGMTRSDPSRKIHVTGLASMMLELEDVSPGSGIMAQLPSHTLDQGMSQNGEHRNSDLDHSGASRRRRQRNHRGFRQSDSAWTDNPQFMSASGSPSQATSASLVDPSTAEQSARSGLPAGNSVATVSGDVSRSWGLLKTWSWRLALRRTAGGSSRQAARRARILEAIATLGDAAAGSLVRPSLADTWVIVRETAAKTLGRIRDPDAIPDLIRILATDESPTVRQAAAVSLCQLRDPVAIPALLQFIQAYPKLSLSIAEGIFQMGGAGVPTLLKVLESGDPGPQAIAMDVLGRLGDLRAVRGLLKGLTNTGEGVRIAAARALGQLRDRRIEPPLRQALSSETSPAVIATLLRALGTLGCEGEPAEFQRFLTHPSADCRAAACQLLARLGDTRSSAQLIRLLSAPESAVRREAALALGHLSAPQAVPALIELLTDPSDEVRAASCRALGSLQDPRSCPPLCHALQDDYETVRIAAAAALGVLGDNRAVAPLCEAAALERLTEPQVACIRALGQLADPASLPHLKDLLKRTPQVKTQAVVAIGQIATAEAVDVLLPLLEDPQAIIRYHATLGLGNIGDPRAIPALAKRISDPESLVVRGVARALGQFSTAQAKILKGQAEAALRSAQDRPAAPVTHVAGALPRVPTGRSSVAAMVVAGLAILGLVLGSASWWGWRRATAPQGTALGTSLAFARGDIAGFDGSSDPNDLRVVTSGGWLERWNPATGQLVSRKDQRIEVGSAACFSGDGRVFVTPVGRQLRVLDSATGEERLTLTVSGNVRWMQLNRTGDELATWEADRGVTIWNLRTGQPVWQIDRDSELSWSVVAVSGDFGKVGLGLASGDVLILETGSNRRPIRAQTKLSQAALLEFSPDGKVLCVANGRGQLVWLDPSNGRVLEQADSQVAGLSAIRWSRDGERLVGIGGDAVFVAERRSGAVRRAGIEPSVSRLSLVFDQIAFDAGERHVAAASSHGRVVLVWSLPDLTPRTSLLASE
jgi:HEAT repeat protein